MTRSPQTFPLRAPQFHPTRSSRSVPPAGFLFASYNDDGEATRDHRWPRTRILCRCRRCRTIFGADEIDTPVSGIECQGASTFLGGKRLDGLEVVTGLGAHDGERASFAVGTKRHLILRIEAEG